MKTIAKNTKKKTNDNAKKMVTQKPKRKASEISFLNNTDEKFFKKMQLKREKEFEKELKKKTNFWALIYMSTHPSPRTGSSRLHSTIVMTKVFNKLKPKGEMFKLAKKESIKREAYVAPVLINKEIYENLFGGIRMNKEVDNGNENGGPLFIQPDIYYEEYNYIIKKNKDIFEQAYILKYDPYDYRHDEEIRKYIK